jgi:hypothetical protein
VADPAASSPDVDDRVLERVRKLLARAEHPTTPPAEAEACSVKAAALMSRYVIDRAMLDAAAPAKSTPVVRRITVDPPYAVPKAVLLDEVARAFRVCVAIGRVAEGDGRRCTLVGFPADVATTELLFTSLLLQASTAMTLAGRGRPDLKAFRRAFLIGYATAIGARLRAVQREAEADAGTAAPGAALGLADRSVQVRAAFAAEFPRLTTMRTTVSSGGGLVAGRAAGARADLTATRRSVDVSHRQRAIGT